MSSPRTEADVRRAIRAHIKELFPGAYVESNPPSPWGESGRPDMELCALEIIANGCDFHGVFVGLELKNPGYLDYPWKGLHQEQELKLRSIATSGGVALITNRAPQRRNECWTLEAWLLNPEVFTWHKCLITGYPDSTSITVIEELK